MSLIPVTTACNQRCLFCSAHGRRDTASLPWVLKEIAGRAASGAGSVILSGGETTFSQDLGKIVAFALKKGLKVELQTNGLTSCYPEKAAWLAGLGVDLFNINFPSHESAVNDRITGTAGTLPFRTAGVKNLLREGATVRLTHIVSTLNFRSLPGFVKFTRKNFPGVKYIQFSYLKGMGLAMENAWLLPEYGQAGPYLVKAFELCEKFGIEAVTDHIPPCFLGRFAGWHIDWIKILNGWDASLSKAEKKFLPACRGCALKGRCFGPRSEHAAMLKGAEMVRPVSKAEGRKLHGL
ncbi:MAG TPA: radical SAM protein [Elusimicrobiales bacterium]|nr:radical SAM protein [Elusimicrobiales bacterium]